MMRFRSDSHAQKERKKLLDFNEVERMLAQELRKLDKGGQRSAAVRSALAEKELRDNEFKRSLMALIKEYGFDTNQVYQILMINSPESLTHAG